MAFVPETGLRDAEEFPPTPASEDEAREQVQGRLDEVRDYINNTLLPALESVITGSSGADRIGSAAITGVESSPEISAVTVHDQLVAIKAIADAAVAAEFTPGCINNANLFTAGVVALAAMAANSVDSDQYVDYSIDPEHLAADTVTQRAIANNAVGADQIAAGAVTNTKIGTQAVEEGNIAQSAVTDTKLHADAVTTTKILDGAVTGAKLDTLDGLTMGANKHIKFNSDNDYVYYNSSEKKLKLMLNGCEEVQLVPVKIRYQRCADNRYVSGGHVVYQISGVRSERWTLIQWRQPTALPAATTRLL